jgi:hypothetical protein
MVIADIQIFRNNSVFGIRRFLARARNDMAFRWLTEEEVAIR